ncbi:Rieske 2Fe-2S domain-containing protein [Ruegeria sp. 2205SS24-7]|uniref:Rieske 2Fe-2S domain-containing protein n=1 Tax=Ruegeria discodermiae TaxID=3064389 RepID=UPI002741727F|nr:Rieske 2Fe-2S domain-containing protein [Ruegeria sp. 2205SS24-7]MDP5218911.1 Rieske 2Fe-2S domain-containing protein [Ruegeria sp. 2205SS24-7]
MAKKIRVCSVDDIEEEDVMRFDHEDKSLIIIHGPDGNFYATDGYCTHEKQHLSEGIVDEFDIECPLHFGAFDYRTGDPTVPPVCVALKTYPVVIEGDEVLVEF